MAKKESADTSEKGFYTGGLDRLGGKKLVQHGADNLHKIQQKRKHGVGGAPRKSG